MVEDYYTQAIEFLSKSKSKNTDEDQSSSGIDQTVDKIDHLQAVNQRLLDEIQKYDRLSVVLE